MRPEVFTIDRNGAGKLSIIPRPRGGDWLADEARALRQAGVNVVVSLLTDEENAEFVLDGEAAAMTKAGLEFLAFPIPDRSVPVSRKPVEALTAKLGSALAEGKHVGFHCRQGIGRSALLAACVLVAEGISVEDAFARIGAARGRSVPETAEQLEWVRRFARGSGIPLAQGAGTVDD